MLTVIASNTNNFWGPGGPDETIVMAPNASAQGLGTTQLRTTLINYGTLSAINNANSVFFAATSSGTFENAAGASVTSTPLGNAVGVASQCQVSNQGFIGSNVYGVVFEAGATQGSVANSGQIFGGFSGVRLEANALTSMTITNSGRIVSDDFGVEIVNGGSGLTAKIRNTGTIDGEQSIQATGGAARLDVVNSGRLIGNVVSTALSAVDKVVNSGTVTGAVKLGGGNDSYSGNGTVSLGVLGEAGNDTLTGGRSVDFLGGGLGNDKISGGAGIDILNGAENNDQITGGTGRDLLLGGTGADRFIYTLVSESRAAGGRDTIGDFSRAQGDKIWLKTIDANTKIAGNQAFTFIGAAAFSGNAGELRFVKSGSSHTNIYADINGDKLVDMHIISDLPLNFIKADFVL